MAAPSKKKPGGTGVLTCAWGRLINLVPKLRLGNPLLAKLLLGKPFM